MEVRCSKIYGYNLGIKLIRGAYMLEERHLATSNKYESPVWDSIDETHKCYNTNMQLVIENMTENDMILVASHNVESVDLAKKKSESFQIKRKKESASANCLDFLIKLPASSLVKAIKFTSMCRLVRLNK